MRTLKLTPALAALALAALACEPPLPETPPALVEDEDHLRVSVGCSDANIGRAKESVVYHLEILPADQKKHGLGANGRNCSGILIGPRAVLTAGHCLWAFVRRPFPRVRIWMEHVTAASVRNNQTREYWPAVPNGQQPPVWHESLDSRQDMAIEYDGFIGRVPDLGLIILPAGGTGWPGLTFPTLGWHMPGGNAPKAVVSSTDNANDFALCKGFQTIDGDEYRRRNQDDYDRAIIALLDNAGDLACVNVAGGWTRIQGGDSGAAWYESTQAMAGQPYTLPAMDQRVLGIERGSATVHKELGMGKCGPGVSAEVATKLDAAALVWIRAQLRAKIPKMEQGDYPVLKE